MLTRDRLAKLYYPKRADLTKRTIFGDGFDARPFAKNPYPHNKVMAEAWDLGRTCGTAAREKNIVEPDDKLTTTIREGLRDGRQNSSPAGTR